MNKKGFTLVELLAVIVILSLLVLLTGTSVTKIVKDSKNDLNSIQKNLIEAAAKAWVADNIEKLPTIQGCIYITLNDLVETGFFDENPKNLNTGQDINNINIKISTLLKQELTINYEIDSKNISSCTYAYKSTPDFCFEYTEDNDSITLTDYKIGTYEDCQEDVIIPNKINNKPVKIIGSSAFFSNYITSVIIPNSVTTIKSAAFYNNKLTTIKIPENVTTIDSNAFNLNELTKIIIPESVTTIGLLAFYDNPLEKVIIKGKKSISDFKSYPESSPFGWAQGYNDSNIIWDF